MYTKPKRVVSIWLEAPHTHIHICITLIEWLYVCACVVWGRAIMLTVIIVHMMPSIHCTDFNCGTRFQILSPYIPNPNAIRFIYAQCTQIICIYNSFQYSKITNILPISEHRRTTSQLIRNVVYQRSWKYVCYSSALGNYHLTIWLLLLKVMRWWLAISCHSSIGHHTTPIFTQAMSWRARIWLQTTTSFCVTVFQHVNFTLYMLQHQHFYVPAEARYTTANYIIAYKNNVTHPTHVTSALLFVWVVRIVYSVVYICISIEPNRLILYII